MIRLTEDVMLEVQKRGCQPLETFIFTLRLKMWPVWQKGMADHIEGVKKLAEGELILLLHTSGIGAMIVSYRFVIWSFGRHVQEDCSERGCRQKCTNLMPASSRMHFLKLPFFQICRRYVVMFNSSVALTSQQEETMIFSK